jgi:hypothetical protein
MKTRSALTLALRLGFAAPAFADDTTATKARSGRLQTSAVSVDAAGRAEGLAAGEDAPVRQAGDRQEGRRAQGVHEGVPVEDEAIVTASALALGQARLTRASSGRHRLDRLPAVRATRSPRGYALLRISSPLRYSPSGKASATG